DVNKNLDGLGFSARFRNYVDLGEDANFELSASAITGKREQPLATSLASGPNAVNVRQSLVGADLTYRWKPLQQGLYKSFLLQAEVMRQINQLPTGYNTSALGAAYSGPTRDFTGGYVFARWQLSQRLFIGGRFDSLQDPALDGRSMAAASGLLEWFPSEFSKLVAQYERTSPSGMPGLDRILLQASFAVGPHKPHPF
ncbi:MAG TPA: hypothetical protein VHE78_13275, partial [Gemmatimonadaceae bacterium]|nr:hypothetical protein [Gemmatimonadaceae bacterium]